MPEQRDKSVRPNPDLKDYSWWGTLMRVVKLALGLFAIYLVLLLGYCFLPLPIYSWHQKMTVEVEKDGKILKASSVIGLRFRRTPNPHGFGYPGRVKGEAVVLEIEPGRYLFALLVSEKNKYEYMNDLAARYAFSQDLVDLGASKSKGSRLKGQLDARRPFWLPYMSKLPTDSPRVLDEQHYPLFVTFKDINDPASVLQVNPDDLAASFGEGTKLKTITLEITDEPVTRGKVEPVLGWIDTHIGRLDGNRYGTIKAKNRFANSLSAGTLKTERKK